MKCNNCGRENDKSMKFCGECGTSLIETLHTEFEEVKEDVSNNVDSVYTQEHISDVELKAKNKKTKFGIGIVAIIVAFACICAVFGTGSKINGVSSDTYKECTKIMQQLSNETYINKIAGKIENSLYQKYGSDWGSVQVSEINKYILNNSDILELLDDINNIPQSTEEDKVLTDFVLFQYAFFMEETMHRGGANTAFAILGAYYSSETGYAYSFEDYQDIYGTFILKYDSIYNTANDIQDIKKAMEEMSTFVKFTAVYGLD